MLTILFNILNFFAHSSKRKSNNKIYFKAILNYVKANAYKHL